MLLPVFLKCCVHPTICFMGSDRLICKKLVRSLTNANTLKLEVTFKEDLIRNVTKHLLMKWQHSASLLKGIVGATC